MKNGELIKGDGETRVSDGGTSSELIYSVRKVFTSYLEGNHCSYYNIPDYQRGYKWTGENVEALLEDIEKFRKSSDSDTNKFYCLQNITLCEAADGNGKFFNVVDGQQRLTTLVILLSYLESRLKSDLKEPETVIKNLEYIEGEKHEDISKKSTDFYKKQNITCKKIRYSVRAETHQFIEDEIITGNIWQKEPEIKHKDQYYLNEVARKIQEWFVEKHPDVDISTYKNVILDKVRFIVNKINTNEEQTFANLNGAKVNLDGADLMRAVLMTHSAKEKFGDTKTSAQVNEFRVRMGMEIDEMNRWWSTEEVSKYFSQMIPEKIEKQARQNGFNIEEFPINILYILLYETKKSKEDFSFRFFEYGIDEDNKPGNDNWELYVKLRKLHLEMQEWYDDKEIYHYLGYLFFRFKGKNEELKFSNLYQEWDSADTKKKFIDCLKELIRTRLLSPYQNEEKSLEEEIRDIKINWYDNEEELINCLVLLDIIDIVNNKSGNLERLPVDYFTRHGEDKEHIGCQTPNNEDRKDKKKWQEYIDTLRSQDEITDDQVEEMKADFSDDSVSEEQINSSISKLNAFGLNSIGNMVLLNLHVNRSYGNNSFSDKRAEIMRNYYEEHYIRPHTLKMFAKIDSKSGDLNKWTIKDIEHNVDEISGKLSEWILG